MNEKKLKKLDLIKKEKPYYYYAYETISCPMRFSVFLHEQCIEQYMTWKPSTKNDYYNYEYNDTTPSLCIVYNNNEIISSSVSMNFMELFDHGYEDAKVNKELLDKIFLSCFSKNDTDNDSNIETQEKIIYPNSHLDLSKDNDSY